AVELLTFVVYIIKHRPSLATDPKAGIHTTDTVLDSCFHRNDKLRYTLVGEALTLKFTLKKVSLRI
ncbi:MAG: hypothetical protein WAV28_18890, partial [Sedimentisphaerales bacterium]